MGRRAVPKIKPEINYAEQFFTQPELEPWQPDVWFGRSAPLEIEIGSGKGLFLRNFGPRQPETNFLGIEVAYLYARYCAAQAVRLGLTNVRAAAANGVEVFRTLVPDNSVTAVHVYFPDPWWKARHKKRRVLNEGFLKDVERTLIPGGTLHFWTDVEEYYLTTLEVIAQHTTLIGPHEVPESEPTHELDYRTHRERRVRLEGLPVYRSAFGKRA